jgi:hypothetical protein
MLNGESTKQAEIARLVPNLRTARIALLSAQCAAGLFLHANECAA